MGLVAQAFRPAYGPPSSPKGLRYVILKRTFKVEGYREVVNIADLSATEIRRLIGARQISALEALDACLARVDSVNPTLNAIVSRNEAVRDEARELDRRLAQGEEPGILCGLPVGIKDVTPVAGLRTTFGSRIYRDHIPDEDALIVQRLRESGALILGKTNCPEFAAGANTFNEVFGPTRNPWDTSKTAGGSTGGGAVGLATGMIALAEGTDLGGSLRIPASFCGVVGLRPAPGLVPTHPTDWVWDTLQVTGPMGRTVEDVALMLQAVCGATPFSPLSQPTSGRDFVSAVRSGVKDGSKVAYCSDISGIGIDPDVEQVCRRAAVGLEGAGVGVEHLEFDLSFARPSFLALRGLWFVTQMSSRFDRIAELGPNVAGNMRSGLQVTTSELGAAEGMRGRVWHQFRTFFERFDLLVTPCMAVPPFPVEQNYPESIAGRPMSTYVDWIAPTFVLSLTGLPVASVPCGLDSNGLPVGLQIVGKPFGEEAVLAMARLVEQLYPIGRPNLIGGLGWVREG
jgi:amidase